MTQAEKVLQYLKQSGPQGATARELTHIEVPQYNWCIKWLRDHGHDIASVQEDDPSTGKKRWRFHYIGMKAAAA